MPSRSMEPLTLCKQTHSCTRLPLLVVSVLIHEPGPMQCKQLKEARELSQMVGLSRLLVALHSRVVPIGSMCYLFGENFGALLGSECWCQCLPLNLKTGQTNAKSKTPSKKKVFSLTRLLHAQVDPKCLVLF